MGNAKYRSKHRTNGLCLYCSEPVYRNGQFCKKHSFSHAKSSGDYYQRNQQRVLAKLRERRRLEKEARDEALKQTNATEL